MSDTDKEYCLQKIVRCKKKNGVTWLNLSDIAKAGDKNVRDWLESPMIADWIDFLQERTVKPIIEYRDSEYADVWADSLLALPLARWIHPDFEIWILDQLYQLAKPTESREEASQTKPILSLPDVAVVFSSSINLERLRKVKEDIESTDRPLIIG